MVTLHGAQTMSHYADSDIMRGLSKFEPFSSTAEAVLDRTHFSENPRGVRASDWGYGAFKGLTSPIVQTQRLGSTIATPFYEELDNILFDILPDKGIEDARGTDSIKALWSVVSTNVGPSGFRTEEEKEEYLRKAWLNFSRDDLHFRWMKMYEFTTDDLIAGLSVSQDQWTPEWKSVVSSLTAVARQNDPELVVVEPKIGRILINHIKEAQRQGDRDAVFRSRTTLG